MTEFDEINALIDWSEFSKLLNPLYSNKKNKQGAAPYNPLMMFKILLFQTWHNLSDPQTENMLARDLLFRQFVGLQLNHSVPDYSSIWRFRDKLNKANLMEPLFDNLNDQLARQSIIIKTGAISIIDATVIQAHHNRPNKKSKCENTQDPEASYNVKQGSDCKRKTTFGFKGHIKCDGDGFITKTVFTTGSVHDSQVLPELLDTSDSDVYADSAYAGKTINALLTTRSYHIQ